MAVKVVASLAALVSFYLTLEALKTSDSIPVDVQSMLANPYVIVALAFGSAFAATGNIRATTYACAIAVAAAMLYIDMKDKGDEEIVEDV